MSPLRYIYREDPPHFCPSSTPTKGGHSQQSSRLTYRYPDLARPFTTSASEIAFMVLSFIDSEHPRSYHELYL
jgi:hypothetical protein